jgi:hypothetical protein
MFPSQGEDQFTSQVSVCGIDQGHGHAPLAQPVCMLGLRRSSWIVHSLLLKFFLSFTIQANPSELYQKGRVEHEVHATGCIHSGDAPTLSQGFLEAQKMSLEEQLLSSLFAGIMRQAWMDGTRDRDVLMAAHESARAETLHMYSGPSNYATQGSGCCFWCSKAHAGQLSFWQAGRQTVVPCNICP